MDTHQNRPFLRTFGAPALLDPNGNSLSSRLRRKDLALLVYLRIEAGRSHSRSALATLLWGDSTEEKALHSLTQALSRLRRAVGAEFIHVGRDGVEGRHELPCDAAVLRELAAGTPDLGAVLEIYTGDFLAEFAPGAGTDDFVKWAEVRSSAYRSLALGVLDQLGARADAAGDWNGALAVARRAVEIDPARESGHRRILRAWDALGERNKALQHYGAFAAWLAEEYGSDPDPDTVAVADGIRERSDAHPNSITPAPPQRDSLPSAAPGTPSFPATTDTHARVAGSGAGPPRPLGAPTLAPPVPLTTRHFTRYLGTPARAWRILSGTALVMLLAGVLWAATHEPGPAAELGEGTVRVAVFPFVVRGAAELAYLGPGMTTLLSGSLDDAGRLSMVDGPLLLAQLRRDDAGVVVDPGSAAEHARQLGAEQFVLGEVIEAGGRLRLHATWYDSGRGRAPVAEARVEGDRDSVFTLVDRLAAELWAERTVRSGRFAFGGAARTTRSLPALRAYLQGEEYFREGRYPAAVGSFQLALALDSTFAYAAYRLGTTAEWMGDWEMAAAASEQALRFSSRLPQRERVVTEALSAARKHDPDTAIRLLRSLLAKNPADVEVLYWLAQTQYRHGALIGLQPHDARAMFDRVVAADPGHQPALMHLVLLAAWEGDRAALDTLIGPLVASVPDDSLRWLHLRAVAGGGHEAVSRLGVDYGTLGDTLLWNLALDAALHTQNLAGTARLAQRLTEPNRTAELRVAGHLLHSYLELMQGRPRAAQRHIAAVAPLDTAAYLEYRALFAAPYFLPISPAEVRAVRDAAASWKGQDMENPYLPLWSDMYPNVVEYFLGVLSARLGDTVAVRRHTAALEAPGWRPLAARLNAMRANAIRARLAAHRDDPAAALALLSQTDFPSSPLSYPRVNHDQRQMRPLLLRDLGRNEEALDLFAAVPWRGSYYRGQTLWDLVHRAPFHFESAELLEQMGQPRAAAEHYTRFLELWSDAEPELQPRVRKARQSLATLRGGSPR